MKIDVALLGATGAVGQNFIRLLNEHSLFSLREVFASERSAGKTYNEAVQWKLPDPCPADTASLMVQSCDTFPRARLVFSALDASVAGPIEKRLAEAGYFVISNAKNHRMDADVPIIIPEINGPLLEKIPRATGSLITNPNCSTAGLALALFPLHQDFGIRSLHTVTMQAVSGAGYPGLSAWDVMGNIIPLIPGEEDKIREELPKIFGVYNGKAIVPASITVTASCNRVPVRDGHMLDLFIELERPASRDDIIRSWQSFQPLKTLPFTPLAPEYPVLYKEEDTWPQPLFLNSYNSMSVLTGRLRQYSDKTFQLKALVHNTMRGAAGNALLIGEWAFYKKILPGL